MTPEQVQQIIDFITGLGTTVATQGFEIAIKQVYVSALQYGIGALFGLAIILMGIRSFKLPEINSFGMEEGDKMVLGVFMIVTGTIIFTLFGTASISRLINSEWYAIKLLLSSI